MATTLEIRKALRLSQRDFAVMLNTSRQTLSLHELGRRSLPARAQKILDELAARIEAQQINFNSDLHEAMLDHDTQVNKRLQKEVERLQWRIISLQQQLEKMRDEHALSLRYLSALGNNRISPENFPHFTQGFAGSYLDILALHARSLPKHQQWLQTNISTALQRIEDIRTRQQNLLCNA